MGSNIHKMKKIISKLRDRYKIADIVVSDPPVEDVIKGIYKE